jgi:hypothetical protein
MDMPYSPDVLSTVRGNGIRGVYGCCLNMSTSDTLAVHLVNWLEQTLLVVEIATVSAY